MIVPPPLKNDCFVLPPGVHWTPVADALQHLRDRIRPVTSVETVPLSQSLGRVAAEDIHAKRASPPVANSAVDGYGFAFDSLGQGTQILDLMVGRAAAGQPFQDTVLPGHCVRVLTGAALPVGVDTVILQEDVTVQNGQIAFHSGLKRGANARRAGEDVSEDAIVVAMGCRIRPQEVALLASVGVQTVSVHRVLRVGVLSTGNEIVTENALSHQIYDANRPMLLGLLKDWSIEAIDLGHVNDDPNALKKSLDTGAEQVDVILTSGGASAGDEDHVSRLLDETGSLGLWRIAIKPGRPLALGMWGGVPVFGLPGNPVAAFVCSLVFAAPVFSVLGGGTWSMPRSVQVKAAFSKNKKAGRTEYLRASLLENGRVDVFESEGSGRISGLSWANGLVELPDEARKISPGDWINYIPFEAFRP